MIDDNDGPEAEQIEPAASKEARSSEAEILLRRERAVLLRRDGLSYREIAVRLGISHGQAHTDVIAALRQSAAENADASHLREQEIARLDGLWRSWYPLARGVDDDGEHVADGPDEGAANVCLRVHTARCKLLGLEAPARVQLDMPTRVRLIVDGDDVTADDAEDGDMERRSSTAVM